MSRTVTIAGDARKAVRDAIAAGLLVPQPCEMPGCNNEYAVAHHDDYAKPLEVRWLCPSHHLRWHSQNGPGKNRDALRPFRSVRKCALCSSIEHSRRQCPLRRAV